MKKMSPYRMRGSDGITHKLFPDHNVIISVINWVQQEENTQKNKPVLTNKAYIKSDYDSIFRRTLLGYYAEGILKKIWSKYSQWWSFSKSKSVPSDMLQKWELRIHMRGDEIKVNKARK